MIERRCQAGFVLKSAQEFLRWKEPFIEDFDGNFAPQPDIPGAIHLTHPPFAEEGEYFIST